MKPPAESSPPAPGGRMHRRDFLLGGIKVSLSLLVLDALSAPLWGQRASPVAAGRLPFAPVDLTRPPAGLDDSLNVMAAYLVHYGPPAGVVPMDGAWRARYDLLEWVGSPTGDGAKFSRRNRVLGQSAVTRRPGAAGAGVGYDLDHTLTLNGFITTLRSAMQCSAAPLPGLREWTTDYAMRPTKGRGAPLRLREQGRHRDGVLEIASAAGVRRLRADRPVLPQWAVMDACRGIPAAPAEAVEFDLLHDLTSHRPRQRLQPCGVLDLSLDGRSHTLRGFVQTGGGTEPTHYWIDAAGRPLLVTAGLFASAMTSLQPA